MYLRCSSRRRRGDVSGGDEGLAHVDDGILEGDVVDAEDFLRGRVDKVERNAKDLGPSAMYFVGSRSMNETVVETRMPARGSTVVQASFGRYALTHLEGNVVRFAPLYEKYNGGKAMSSHWMKRRNATIFEPPHKKRRGRVSQNYRDELQRRRAKKARRRANHRE